MSVTKDALELAPQMKWVRLKSVQGNSAQPLTDVSPEASINYLFFQFNTS